MSIVKIVVCLILSCGIYSIYWFFKHWSKYQKTTNEEVYPFVNAWFNIFTAPSLFSRIDYSIHSNKKIKFLGIIYLVGSLFFTILIRLEENHAVEINDILIFLIITALLIINISIVAFVQNEINKYNKKTNKTDKVKILNIKY